jgi:large subunit ribosomal protein L31
MAKAGIHPEYHEVNIVMTDGTSHKTRSTYGKEGDSIRLDVDPKTHPAWVGGVHMKKTGRVERFNNRFAGLGIASDAAIEAATNSNKKEDKK